MATPKSLKFKLTMTSEGQTLQEQRLSKIHKSRSRKFNALLKGQVNKACKIYLEKQTLALGEAFCNRKSKEEFRLINEISKKDNQQKCQFNIYQAEKSKTKNNLQTTAAVSSEQNKPSQILNPDLDVDIEKPTSEEFLMMMKNMEYTKQ